MYRYPVCLLQALPFLVCKDVFDSSGVDKASLAVVFEVVESHGDAAQGLEAAVDGFSLISSAARMNGRIMGALLYKSCR